MNRQAVQTLKTSEMDRAASRPVGKGKSFYPSTLVWKIFKYEYASDIF